jgi:hypothetical protein
MSAESTRPEDVGDWRSALTGFLASLPSQRKGDFAYDRIGDGEWLGWEPTSPPGGGLHPWDDPVFAEGGTVVEFSGSGSSYIRLYATVRWPAGVVHLTRQDEKTGAMDASRDLPLPPEWLAAFKSVPWPDPPKYGPWF